MRALFDNAEKDDLAAAQPFFGGDDVVEERADALPAQRHRARLAVPDLDDQILIAPDRDEKTRGIGDPFDDPADLAAPQPGALEPRRGIIIMRSHRANSRISSNAAASRAGRETATRVRFRPNRNASARFSATARR